MVRKWPTESLKVQACKLRKTGLTNDQILQKFIAEGKITQTPKPGPAPANPTSSALGAMTTPPIPPSALPPDLRRIVEYTAAAQAMLGDAWRPSDTISYLKEKDRIGLQRQRETVRYRRPGFLAPKQGEIVDAVLDPGVKLLMVEGDQRTGKSTAVFNGIMEYVVQKDPLPLKIDMMAGKGKQCERLLADLSSDVLNADLVKELIPTLTQTKAVFWNGSVITCHETTVADIKGSDANIIWIDEMDVAIKSDPHAVFSALMVLRARTELKIVLSANMDKGVYMAVRDKLQQANWGSLGVRFLTLCKADVPHIAKAGNDELLAEVGAVLVGQGYADMRLKNKPDVTGDIFPPATLKLLMDEHAVFTATLHEPPDYTVLAIDPSLTGHPIGWFLGGYAKGTWYEIESGQIQFGDGMNGTWTEERIKTWLLDTQRIHKVKCVVMESNTLGPILGVFLRSHGIRCLFQNYGSDSTENSRETFLSVCALVMDDHAFLFRSQELYQQFILYDPDNAKKEGKYKGDLADAAIHFIYYCAGGPAYLKKAGSPGQYQFVERENYYEHR